MEFSFFLLWAFSWYTSVHVAKSVKYQKYMQHHNWFTEDALPFPSFYFSPPSVWFTFILNLPLKHMLPFPKLERGMCNLLPVFYNPFSYVTVELHAWKLFVVHLLSKLFISFKQENSREESRGLVHQVSNESRLSIADSLTEFFDAQEVLLSASSSENEVWALRLPHSVAISYLLLAFEC